MEKLAEQEKRAEEVRARKTSIVSAEDEEIEKA